MGTKYAALATALLAALTLSTAQAAEPKHGGILHIYHRETPPSLSIHEEATFSVNVPAMPIFNNLVDLRPAQAAKQHGHHRARSGDRMGLEQGRTLR